MAKTTISYYNFTARCFIINCMLQQMVELKWFPILWLILLQMLSWELKVTLKQGKIEHIRDKKIKDLVNRYEEKIYSCNNDKRVMDSESFDRCCILDTVPYGYTFPTIPLVSVRSQGQVISNFPLGSNQPSIVGSHSIKLIDPSSLISSLSSSCLLHFESSLSQN